MRLCAALLLLCRARGSPASPLTELNDAIYEPFIEVSRKAAVLAYRAEEDGRALLPLFQRVSESLRALGLSWATVDLGANVETAKMLEGAALPGVLLYEDAQWVAYRGELAEQPLSAFVRDVLGAAPNARVLRGAEELREAERGCAVGLFYAVLAEEEARQVLPLLRLLANQYRICAFAAVAEGSALAAAEYKLRFKRNFNLGDKEFKSKGLFDALFIKRVVEGYHHRLCLPVEAETLRRVYALNAPTVLVFTNSSDAPAIAEVERAILQANHTLACAVVDRDSPQWPNLASMFAVSVYKLPFVGVFELHAQSLRKYALPSPTAESLEQFLRAYVEKTQPVYYKSEELPGWQDPLVKTVVRKNFQGSVLENPHSVFLCFLDRWCEDCLNVFYRLKEIATALRESYPQVQFGIVDSELNDIDGMGVQRLPSFHLYKAGEKDSPIRFAQPLSASAVEEFLRENLAERQPKKESLPSEM